MRFGSVCSGIEAASVAWEPLGWKAAWFSEIEPFPSAVLAHHYPEVKNLGDMTQIPALIQRGEVEAPDILCGGTPCQAFSVAGLRRSLDDARGNLSLTFCEIANAIDSVRRSAGMVASIVFWENVPGVLSTKDNAFGCFLAGLAGEDEALVAPGGRWTNAGFVDGPTRAVAWRVLDAQYFGLAQRRKRVFVVASARDGFDPAAVLLEFDGVRRDSAPSREAGQSPAPPIAGCANGGGANGPGRDVDSCESLQVVSMCLNAGGQRRLDAESETLIPTIGGGFDVAHSLFVPVAFADTAPTLSVGAYGAAGHPHRQHGNETAIIGMQFWKCPDCGNGMAFNHRGCRLFLAHAFDARQSGVLQYGNMTGLLQPVAFRPTQDPISSSDGSTHAMGCGSKGGAATVAQPIGFGAQMSVPQTDVDLMQTLQAKNPMAVAQPVATDIKQIQWASGGGKLENDTAQALGSNAEHNYQFARIAMQVRRLTPTECERLQGFPDGYTAIPWRKKPASECPDGPRYKALGNSWAVPVVRWIGQRIKRASPAP